MLPVQPKERLAYTIRPPKDWLVESFADGITVVHSPDWEAFSLVEYQAATDPPKDLAEILAKGRFKGVFLFSKPKAPQMAKSQSSDSASATVSFTTSKGTLGLAAIECIRKSRFIVLQAFAAPANLFDQLSGLLRGCIRLPDQPVTQPDDQFSLPPGSVPLPPFAHVEISPPHVAPAGDLAEALLSDKPSTAPTPVAPMAVFDPETVKNLMEAFAKMHAPAADPAPGATTSNPAGPGASHPGLRGDPFSAMDQYIRDTPSASVPQHSPQQSAVPAPLPPKTPAAQTAPPPQAPPPSPWVRFTEPQKGTFVMEVPRGWKMEGGFEHPMPGDRRLWFAVHSPDDIYIACDPELPQNLCHFRDQVEGQYATLAAGGQLLNLTPTAERMGDYYLQNIAPHCFGPIQRSERRARPDVIKLLQMQLGPSFTPRVQITADEQLFTLSRNGKQVSLSVLTSAVFNGEYVMWNWGFWEANVWIYLASPELAARAEQVRGHMQSTIQRTPNFIQIYQQDEAQIAANSRNAHAAQVNWFNQQQAQHNAQNAIGNSIVASFWRR